ncbi:TolC family protein [bacterium]|nr:TolC family protein [bacterium]
MADARDDLRFLPFAVLLLAFASGCVPSLADNPVRDVRRDLPGAYDSTRDAGSTAAVATDDPGRMDWREYFRDPDLRALIEAALDANQELNVRTQEIFIAQAEAAAKRGEYLPRLGAGVGIGGDKVSLYTSQGYSDRATGLAEVLADFAFGFRASWEVDVWGRLRKAAAAADRRYLASREARNFMVTQVIAEIARNYYELVAIDGEIEVLRRNLQVQSDALDVVRAQKLAGRVTELAVQRFEGEVLKTRGRVFDLDQERVQARNRINVLAGRYPAEVPRTPEFLAIPLPHDLSTGLPTQLLENRADVRRAALELEAARLDVASSRLAFLPSVSLDAGLGYRAFDVSHLVATPEALAANLAGNLVAPLLNRSAIEAKYRQANAQQVQAVFEYERTLLQAYTDVVNQLARYQNLTRSYGQQAERVDVLGRAIDVSNTLFQAARADYAEVLMVRRESLDAQTELIETKKRLLLATVDLYVALGGGWRGNEGNPAPS